MGFRFYHRSRILPFVTINESRSGPSVSVGVPGAHVTFGRRLRTTLGLPGSGMYWTQSYAYQSLGLGRAAVRFIVVFVVTLALLVAIAAFAV